MYLYKYLTVILLFNLKNMFWMFQIIFNKYKNKFKKRATKPDKKIIFSIVGQ